MNLKNITKEFIKTTKDERHEFDFKSIKIDGYDIARHATAFANADGGLLIIGV